MADPLTRWFTNKKRRTTPKPVCLVVHALLGGGWLPFAVVFVGAAIGAGPAPSMSNLQATGGAILKRQFVPMFAVGQSCCPGGDSRAAQGVFFPRHGFQMPRIHAPPIAAQVVNTQALGNGAAHLFVQMAMGIDLRGVQRGGELGVPIFSDVAYPIPTPIFLNQISDWRSTIPSRGTIRERVWVLTEGNERSDHRGEYTPKGQFLL